MSTDNRTHSALRPHTRGSPPTEIQEHRALDTTQCDMCHTTNWRKNEWKATCFVCTAHPISTDVIRKCAPFSRFATAPHTSTLSLDTTTHETGEETAEYRSTTTSELVRAQSSTDTNNTSALLNSNPGSDSHMEPVPIMIPQSIKQTMSRDSTMRTLVTKPEDVGFEPQDISLSLPSQSPVSYPENIYLETRSESNSVSPPDDEPPSLDIGRLKEHAGLELALIAVLATVTLSITCSDRKEDYLQVCLSLGIVRPIFLIIHFGAALTTCAILFMPQSGGNGMFSRYLRVLWTVLFGLGLCSIVIQVSLYAWTTGNLVTRSITALLAILCSLPGFYLIRLKWHPALQPRDIES